ncbi:MAG: hypothetical protein WAU78_17180 [Roseiarcus sp.]
MKNYVSDWVPDDAQALQDKLTELSKKGNRVINVVYRPASEESAGSPPHIHKRSSMFIIVSETNPLASVT